MKSTMRASLNKPTHPGPGGEVWIRSGGQYRPRVGNSNGVRKRKRSKQNLGIKYVPPVVIPHWVRKWFPNAT